MANSSYFFDDLIRYEGELPYARFNHCLSDLIAISEHLNKTFIIIDQYKRKIKICNNNPDLSNLFTEDDSIAFEKDEDTAFLNKIPSEYHQLFAHINTIINDYILSHCNEGENLFYFSFQLPLLTDQKKQQMCEFKVFPFLYTDFSSHRKPWITFYQCDLCNALNPGKLTMHIPNNPAKTYYLLKPNSDYLPNYIMIKESDLKIFSLACQGFSESEIAHLMQISVGALKRVKSNIMMYINTQSTAHTIAILNNQGLL